jgi:hypothetical protein
MPIHDWTRVDAGLFHHFHQEWTVSLCDALNAGALPPDYFALVEQKVPGPIPDVLTLRLADRSSAPANGTIALAVADAPPRAQMVGRTSLHTYSARANRVTVRHRHGDVVSIIEIVSPGNKASVAELRAFVDKSASFLRQGIHLLVVDLFPPTPRDPHGIHRAIWEQFEEEQLKTADSPTDRARTLAAYCAASEVTAYVETRDVGQALPDMPIFLTPDVYILAPLEATYQTVWGHFPKALRGLLEDS